MATTLIEEPTALPTAVPAASVPSTEEQHIKNLWTALHVAEKQLQKRGLQFGQGMYEYREKHSAQGRRTDLSSYEEKLETFGEFCERMDIPRSTADRWIARYEESIGERPPAPAKSKAEPESEVEDAYVAAPTEFLGKPVESLDNEVDVLGPSVFEDLISTLYSLTKSGPDGVEHKFVRLLDNAAAYLSANPNLDEDAESSRNTVVYLLNRVAKEFQGHALMLSTAVQ